MSVYPIYISFVWRQSEFAFFSALTAVGALFCFGRFVMRIIKKSIFSLLLGVLAVCTMGFFAACDNDKKDDSTAHTHSYTTFVVAPTCTVKGYTTYTCACGDTYKDNYVNATGHNYTTQVISPTCTTQGYTTYTCTCGDNYKDDYENALGHSFTNYVSNNDATYGKDGTETATCDRNGCNAKDTRTDEGSMLSHTHNYSTQVTPPTCTTQGYTSYTCSCGDTYKSDYENALGHSFTNYVSNNDATYKNDGTETATCDRNGCTAKDTRTDEGSMLVRNSIAFKTFTVSKVNDTAYNVYGKVANGTTIFSFLNEITVNGNASYTVSTDITGLNVIPTKTVSVVAGNNIFYVLADNGEGSLILYTVTVRVREMYTVSFNSLGGSTVASQQVEEDSFAQAPSTTPTKTGYTFKGWDFDFANTPITDNTTITANAWQANTYTVFFDGNGGTNPANKTVTYNGVYGELPTSTQSGYIFKGWTTEKDGGSLITATTSVTIASNHTLYAKWQSENVFEVTYDANGGTGAPSSQEKNRDVDIILSSEIPTKDGYVFMGWNNLYESTTYQAGNVFSSNFNVTLYAIWAEVCDDCGGDGEITSSSRCPYCLTGRICKSCGSSNVVHHVTGVGSYYLCNNCTSINTKACTSCSGTGTSTKTQTCGTCSGVGHLQGNAPTATLIEDRSVTLTYLEGYEYSKDGVNWQSSNIFEDLTAQTTYTFYQRKATSGNIPFGTTSNPLTVTTNALTNYSIAYTLDGGDATNPTSYTYETDSFTLTEPTKTGYVFLGWTGSNGEELQKTVVISKHSEGDMSFIAHWEIGQFTVSFDTQGGEAIESITQEYNSYVSLPTTTYYGKTFVGWFNESYTMQYFGGVAVPAEDITLYAKWIDYKVSMTYTDISAVKISDTVNAQLLNVTAVDTNGNPVIVEITVAGTQAVGETIDICITATGLYGISESKTLTDIVVLDENQSLLILYKDSQKIGTQLVYKNHNYALPSYTGYTCVWYYNNIALTDENGNALAVWNKDSGAYVITADCQIIRYSISYEMQNGTNHSSNPTSYTVASNSITLLSPTKTGYTFMGWTGTDISTLTKEVTIASGSIGARTYTANWQVNSYTITFNKNGGEYDKTTQIATYDSAYALTNPTRVGYTFVGWYNGETLYSGGTWKTASDITLTAKWTANTNTHYVVKHYQQNILDDGYTLFATQNLTGTSDKSVSPNVNTYTGFTSPSKQTVNVNPDGSRVVNYYYTRNYYTITVVGNGGTSTTVTQKYQSVVNTETWSTRDGFTLEGFYLNISQSERYTDTILSVGNKTVYAHWAEENYAYEFNYTTDTSGVTITKYVGNSSAVTIPEYIGGKKVIIIATSSFRNQTQITTLVVPDSVTSIDSSAFYGCNGLQEITLPFVGASRIADSYTGVFGYIFGYTSSTSYSGPTGTTKQYYSNPYSYYYYIPTTITKATITDAAQIPNNAFYNCANIQTIILNDEITSIGESSFEDCSTLTSIEIPDNVTLIGASAFRSCSSLTSIVIPDSVTSISEAMFLSCSSLTSIVIPDGVTSIGGNAFGGCGLTSIVIPDSVTSIDKYAFSGCPLTEITLPFVGATKDESTYAYLGYIFGGGSDNVPTSLKTVKITGGTQIAAEAFRGCSGLTSIVIPDGVTSIGERAFQDCSSLTSIVIPDGVTSIGELAFQGCSSLTSIVIPDSVTSMGEWAFYGCSSLTSIVIPDGVTSIGKRAFQDCSSLTSIVIPDGVTSIGELAFYGCSCLINVYYSGTNEQWSKINIGSSNTPLTNATLYYYSADEPELNADGTVYDGNYWHYVDGAVTVWKKETV